MLVLDIPGGISNAVSTIDVDALLEEISSDSPCGEDLEYDPQFGEMERAARGKAEQQFGDTIVEAVEPEWREVRDPALELFSRTKDLRVAVYLTQAMVHLEGFVGLRDGLTVLQGPDREILGHGSSPT